MSSRGLGLGSSLGVSSSGCNRGLPRLGSYSVGSSFPIKYGAVLNRHQLKTIISEKFLYGGLQLVSEYMPQIYEQVGNKMVCLVQLSYH